MGVLPHRVDHAIDRGKNVVFRAWWSSAGARREWGKRLLALAFGVLLSWAMMEGLLRLRWVPLPERLAMKLHGCYEPGDTYQSIYFVEPHLHVLVFKPNFETTCVFNRLRWKHHGDRWGFRNPESWDQADVVLLGDSMTYGHGVEEDETIAHFLREDLGTRVANLGITSGSPVEYLAYFRNFSVHLSPKVVVALVFANDVEDIDLKRTKAEQRAFVETNTAPELDVFDPAALVDAAPEVHRLTLERIERWTLTYQTWLFYRPMLEAWLHDPLLENRRWIQKQNQRVHANHQLPSVVRFPGAPLPEEIAGSPLAVAYARKAFAMLADTARKAGISFVLAFLPELDKVDESRDDVMENIIREAASSSRLPFLDLRPALSGPDGRAFPGDRIPVDGHLTAQGSRRAATAIARFVREQNLMRGH